MTTITGPILDSAGRPANGRIRFAASSPFDSPAGLVTTAWATAEVLEGIPYTAATRTKPREAWTLPPTPEGVWFRIEQDLDGSSVQRFGATVPDTTTLAYSQLLSYRNGVGVGWQAYVHDLSGGAEFPPDALIGDVGYDFDNGNLWRNDA